MEKYDLFSLGFWVTVFSVIYFLYVRRQWSKNKNDINKE